MDNDTCVVCDREVDEQALLLVVPEDSLILPHVAGENLRLCSTTCLHELINPKQDA